MPSQPVVKDWPLQRGAFLIMIVIYIYPGV